MTWNFATVFEALGRVRPGDVALMHGERTVTWAELDGRAARLASGLRAAGLSDGDVVAQYLPNCPEYLETFVALSKARLAPMNTNYRYVEDELLEVWQDANARAVVYDVTFADRVEALRERLPQVRAWIEVGGGSTPVVPGAVEYESMISANEPIVAGSGDADSLVLIYTGGTTGRPKGVMWRQADLLSLLNVIAARPLPDEASPAEIDSVLTARKPGIRAVVACPLMHGFGLFYSLSELISGDTVITLPAVRYEPELLLDAIEVHGVKSVALVGDAFARPLLDRLDAEPDRWDVSSIRVLMSSGVMWSAPVKEGLLRHMPKARMIDGLGSSEASGIGATHSTTGQVAETASFVPTERAAVLLDDGTLAAPGDGKVGKLAVTGWLPLGYLNDPDKTATVFVEAAGRRWSTPGDMAMLDADGRIKLLGRGSSCINTGGEKVFPEEVEQVLLRHPAVADVAVVGVPDERFGQTIVALVEPAGTPASEDELREHVRANLAGYKVPRLFHPVSSIERAPNGKLDHRRLAEIARTAWAGVRVAAR